MKVLVTGATGGTGSLLVPLLLEAGHEVTAFARKPEMIKLQHARLRAVRGEARDAESIDFAVTGQEAVLSTLGPRSLGKDDLQEAFLRNLVSAMERQGVKRLINLSAWGAGESRKHSPFIFKMIQSTILRHVFTDKNRAEAYVDKSLLDYTHVRPGRLLDKPARGGVRASLDGAGLKAEMTRADLAAFMASQLTDPAWVRKAPLIGY